MAKHIIWASHFDLINQSDLFYCNAFGNRFVCDSNSSIICSHFVLFVFFASTFSDYVALVYLITASSKRISVQGKSQFRTMFNKQLWEERYIKNTMIQSNQ